ncbi:unnamed protein product [Urochloa humidicola]
MLSDSAKQGRNQGKLVINNTEVNMVKLAPILTKVQKQHNYTDFTFYDGTGTIIARQWPGLTELDKNLSTPQINKYYIIHGTPRHDKDILSLSLHSARLVTNHNDITHHMFATIYEHLDLQLKIEKLESTDETKQKKIKESVLTLLSKEEHRESESGPSFQTICETMKLDRTTAREVLSALVDEAKVYNSTDYNHFKSCVD